MNIHIVGAGSVGVILASRLKGNPYRSVCLFKLVFTDARDADDKKMLRLGFSA